MTDSVEHFDWDAVIDELQKPGGWRKGLIGAYAKREGSVCLMGAIRRVERTSQRDAPFASLIAVIKEQFPERVVNSCGEPARFNDHDATTLDDVIFVCEKARAKSGELS